MNITRNIVAASQWGIKCPYPMTPEFIVVHNTANDASAANEVSYMRTNSNLVSFHYAIDDISIVQGVDENRNTWNAGDGNGDGNRKGISMEICYSKSGGARFVKAEQNAALFIAETLKRYGWDISKVKKHQDFNGKYCPHRTLDLGWDRFISMIKNHITPVVSVPAPLKLDEGITLIANDRVSVWDLTTNPDYKAVKILSKGEEFEAYGYIPFNGTIYYVTKYSFDRGLKNGVNQGDMTLKSKPVPDVIPIVIPEPPVVTPPEPISEPVEPEPIKEPEPKLEPIVEPQKPNLAMLLKLLIERILDFIKSKFMKG